jgi:hypothetical protein
LHQLTKIAQKSIKKEKKRKKDKNRWTKNNLAP